MNPVIEQINAHKSIRRFSPNPVPDDVIKKILTAGSKASSSGNMQVYSIIVTKDPNKKKELFKAHFEQEVFRQAPVFLTFCADFHRMRKWLELKDAPDNFDNFMSFMIATIDATLASQNAALAAESLGLGICFLGTTLASCKSIAKTLNCPTNVVPVVGFALGYPAEQPNCRDRLPLAGLVHNEEYPKLNSTDIQSTYEEREKSGWKRYRSIPELKSQIKSKKIQNLAQVYTQLKYTKESHIGYSRDVLEFIKSQMFFNQ